MRRRDLLASLAGAAVVWPLAGQAQQSGKVHRIGLLETTPADLNVANLSALRRGLQELGYVEGKNLVIEYRSADGRGERFPALVAELLHLKVDVLVTRGTPAALAAKRATTTVPVVMTAMGDPFMVVSSLARPGGNVTGLSAVSTELEAKRFEVLKELVPGIARVAGLYNMGNPVVPPQWRELQRAAQSLGVQALLLDVRQTDDIAPAFDTARRAPVGGLIVGVDALTQTNRTFIAELAAKLGIPAVYASREHIEAGGLIAYGSNYPDLYRRSATYIDKILKGERPGDLPIQQPTKFEMIINLKAAKALGLTVPPTLLARADEVIE